MATSDRLYPTPFSRHASHFNGLDAALDGVTNELRTSGLDAISEKSDHAKAKHLYNFKIF